MLVPVVLRCDGLALLNVESRDCAHTSTRGPIHALCDEVCVFADSLRCGVRRVWRSILPPYPACLYATRPSSTKKWPLVQHLFARPSDSEGNMGGGGDETKRSHRLSNQRASMVIKRRRFKQTHSLQERLAEDTERLLRKCKCCRSVLIDQTLIAGLRRTRPQFRFAKFSDRRGCSRQNRSSSCSSIRRTLSVQTDGSPAIGHSRAIRTSKRSSGQSS